MRRGNGKEKINFDSGFSMARSRVVTNKIMKNLAVLPFLLNKREMIKGSESVDKKLEYS